MKKILGKLGACVLYLILVCYLLGFEWSALFDLRLLLIILAGGIILCLPLIRKEQCWRERGELFGRNAFVAGYLTAFLLLYANMSQKDLSDHGLLKEMALNLRPILYGSICYLVFRMEKRKQPDGQHLSTPNESMEQPKKEVHQETVECLETTEEQDNSTHRDLSALTSRERQIAGLVHIGLTNREIAAELFISETTVKKHLSNIFEKLEIRSRKEL